MNGEYGKADPLFRQTLDIRRTKLGDDSIPVADSLSSLGDRQFLEGKNEEPEANLQEALATFRRHSPNLGSSTRDCLARLLLRKGDYLEAVQLLAEAVEIDRRNEGIDGPNYAITLHNLAGALWSAGDLYTAEAKVTESLETKRRVLGNDHPDLAYPLNILGIVALDEGDWWKAEPLLRASFAIWSGHGPNHALTLTSSTNWDVCWRQKAVTQRCARVSNVP
jgi:tetratricopeptide (TPR) repeat protein